MGDRYIYIHLRPDGECFYVGKGTKKPRSKLLHTIYRRAYCYRNRNPDWHDVAKNGFTVKIVEDDIESDEIASEREQAWVAQFWGTPALVNRTRGGCGLTGYKMSPESIERGASKRRGKMGGARHPCSQPLYVYDATTGDFIARYVSHMEAGKALPINTISIKNALKRESHRACDYLFYHEDQGPKVEAKHRPTFHRPRPIERLSPEGVVLGAYPNIVEAARAMGMHAASISNCCHGKQIGTIDGSRWRHAVAESITH